MRLWTLRPSEGQKQPKHPERRLLVQNSCFVCVCIGYKDVGVFVKVEGFSAGVELCTFIYLFFCKTNNKKKKSTRLWGKLLFFVCVQPPRTQGRRIKLSGGAHTLR